MRSHIQLITSTLISPFLPRLGYGKMFQMNRFPSTAISFIGGTVLMVSTGAYVCMLKSPSSVVLSNLYHIDHEVFWAELRPQRLPRGFSNIIVGVVYQPPDANDATMKDYLITSLENVESEYPNSAIIMAGDFNKTLMPLFRAAVRSFQLKPMVDFPTRGERLLDQIFTNLSEFYSCPRRLPAFGLSDHLTVLVSAGNRKNQANLSTRSSRQEIRDQVRWRVWVGSSSNFLCPTYFPPCSRARRNLSCLRNLSISDWTLLCLNYQ